MTAPDLGALRQMMDVSFTSLIETIAAAMPHLLASRGRIVLSASAAGESGVQGQAAYSAAKHGKHGLSRTRSVMQWAADKALQHW